VIEYSEDAMKEHKHEDAKQALFIRSQRLRITTTAFDVGKLIKHGELAVGKPFHLTIR
jgi:hypothetical protein